jgi:hypothetical protein
MITMITVENIGGVGSLAIAIEQGRPIDTRLRGKLLPGEAFVRKNLRELGMVAIADEGTNIRMRLDKKKVPKEKIRFGLSTGLRNGEFVSLRSGIVDYTTSSGIHVRVKPLRE